MVKEKFEVYKCPLCGNIITVLKTGGGTLVCCGKEMELLKEQTADSATEKHVPVIEKIDAGIKVKVGSVPHPMLDNHFIQWIDVEDEEGIQIKFLAPNAQPETSFLLKGSNKKVREYCNLHGLWKS